MSDRIEERVVELEEHQHTLEDKVGKMEVVQSGLTEAVKSIKDSVDKLNSQFTWMCKLMIGSVWAAIVITLVKDIF